MANQVPQQQPVTGRTTADAVVELTRLTVTVFGIGTPFIIVVAAAAFGFLELQKVYQETDRRRAEAMTVALKETRSSYESIAELNKKQIATIDDTLTIQDRLSKSLQALDAEQEKQSENLRTVEQELEKARAEMEAEIERQRRTAEQLQATQEKLKKKAEEEDQRAKKLVKRVGDNTELRLALKELADAVKQELPATSRSHQLATKFIDKHVIDPVDILTRYAKEPTNKLAIATLENIAGLSEARLIQLMNDSNGFGFPFWGRVQEPGESGSAFFSAVNARPGVYMGLVVLEVNQGTIVDAGSYDEVFATKLFDHEDWLRTIAIYAVVKDDEFDFNYASIASESETWRLGESPGIRDYRIEYVHQADDGVAFLGPDEFRRRLSQRRAGQTELNDVYEPPGLNLAMHERAQRFERLVLAQADLDRLPDSMRDPFRQFLRSAVGRKRDTGAVMIDPKLGGKFLGSVAAVALRPEFRIVKVETAQTTLEQQQGGSSPVVEPARYNVEVQYRNGEGPQDIQTEIWILSKREGHGGWLFSTL